MYFVTALVYYYALGKSVIVLTRKKYKVSVDQYWLLQKIMKCQNFGYVEYQGILESVPIAKTQIFQKWTMSIRNIFAGTSNYILIPLTVKRIILKVPVKLKNCADLALCYIVSYSGKNCIVQYEIPLSIIAKKQ